MKEFKQGDIVVVSDGRAGMVRNKHFIGEKLTIQFGADGPFENHHPKSMRWATDKERKKLFGLL